MMTPTPTPTRQRPASPQTPSFAPQQPDETPADWGRRALLFVMQHGEFSTWRLDDRTLEAAHHAAGLAQTGRQLPADVVAHLATLQRHLRALVAARAADKRVRLAALQALIDAGAADPLPAADASPSEPADSGTGRPGNGGGGSKVPRQPRPQGHPPAGGLALPALALPAADLF